VGRELALDRRVVLDRVGSLTERYVRRDVEHMDQQPRALDVREEVVAEPGAVARALDQTGDVGDDELAFVTIKDAQHRRERRERVARDLRRRTREARQERGLARVRQADQSDVREQLELKLDPSFLPGQAALGEARRLASRGREPLVAPAAAPAPREEDALALREQFPAAPDEVPLLVLRACYLGAGRHPQPERLPFRAVAL
jgi:hypothetical protein